MNDSSVRSSRWLLAASVGIAVLFVAWWYSRPPRIEPSNSESINPLSDIDGFEDGEFFPLPFTDSGIDGMPLQGRPDEPMPICREIYSNVDLKLDGKPVKGDPIIFQSGATVHVEGVIHAHSELDQHVTMSAGFGLVSRAQNERGWIIRHWRFFKGHTSLGRSTFVGDYVVPDEPRGEYILVLLSDAHVGMGDHPILLAAEYDAVIEEPAVDDE